MLHSGFAEWLQGVKKDAVEMDKLVLVYGRQWCGFVWHGEGGFGFCVPAGLHWVMKAVVTRLQLVSKTLVWNIKILVHLRHLQSLGELPVWL